ncbi:MAG TPA: hypothetical protein VGL47_23135 [Amycolatopsis sp.]|uniref:Secreted protein n=1 Tax=Amycolatopsis nalaikhensis TaxID=715472 RepID=A0ABY8XN41_9PSEU|nr:hypothetical protein [Amycolatopsis sp. 2-2]WIV57049.1 hypothetical protein QP939_51295 [Amycolatopsis sp. 2-2]
MRTRARFIAVAAAGAALAAVGSAFGVSSATTATTADDTPPPIVEDYSYPGAAKVFQDRALTLISGDGHITLTPCGQSGLLEVHAYNSADHSPDPGHYCFKVSGPTGYLRLEVPYAYQVKGDSHTVQATVEINGQNSTVPVAKNGWTGIGEGAGTDPSTLLELRASA